MMDQVDSITYRRLRTPRTHRSSLVDPPLAELAATIEENQSRLDSQTTWLLDVPLAQVARQARADLLRQAIRYTARYRVVSDAFRTSNAESQFLVTGHQPHLFHPGVWFKNFLLHQAAVAQNAVGIHLLIDNDVLVHPGISVLTGSPDDPRTESVPFDVVRPPMPFEERTIQDAATFARFAARVAERMRPFVTEPIVERLWSYAIEARQRSDNLGRCLAEARHRFEADEGLETLELPLSYISDSAGFALFVAHLLDHAEDFRQRHNEAVREYRRVHRLRSSTHPVPLLRQRDGWTEAPFWVWTESDPTRRPLYARRCPDGRLALVAREPEMDSHSLLIEPRRVRDEGGAEWVSAGWKVRPRALTTTLYARLCLSDLFIHGIGGAKYDQVTDAIIERFFHIQPPVFAVATATVQLGWRPNAVEPDDIRQVNGHLRDLWYHPEGLAGQPGCVPQDAGDYLQLAAEKKRFLDQLPPRGHRLAWHQKLQRINTRLRTHVASCRTQLLRERQRLLSELRKDTILSSREYSFCLYEVGDLPRTLLDLCRG